MLFLDGNIVLKEKGLSTINNLSIVEIDREITPILAELFTFGPGNDHHDHPTVKQLFNWLAEPQRTGEEFAYVTGELAEEVANIMEEQFPNYFNCETDCSYISSTTAEVLALRCPILEGAWELVAWTMLATGDTMGQESSDRFKNWIVHVIADPDMCPNPYLRFELISLLIWKFGVVKRHNRTKVIGSILSACSHINIAYLDNDILEYHKNHGVDSVLTKGALYSLEHLKDNIEYEHRVETHHISTYLQDIAGKKGHLLELDNQLAIKLKELKSERCSAIISDVGCHSAMKSTKFTEPRELYGLEIILKSENRKVASIYKEIQTGMSTVKKASPTIHIISDALFGVIKLFKSSCQTHQLLGLTSTCIMNIVELLVMINEILRNKKKMLKLFRQSLVNTDFLLQLIKVEDEIIYLTSRPIRSDVIKKRFTNSNDSWDLGDSYDLFHETFKF